MFSGNNLDSPDDTLSTGHFVVTEKPPISDKVLWAYVHELSEEERREITLRLEDPIVAQRLKEIGELHQLLSSAGESDAGPFGLDHDDGARPIEEDPDAT